MKNIRNMFHAYYESKIAYFREVANVTLEFVS